VSRRESFALPLVLFAVCAAGVAHIEPRLATELHAIKDTDDVYPFPPPVVLRLATLGYVDATTDILWGKLLVENGSHWGEHRPFGDLEHYLEAIHHLDPLYWPLYDYVDSLLCYRPMNGHEPDARLAREYLLEGTKLMPTNPEIWRKYGQFVAFMGPSYLSDAKEKEAWKKEGALALEHAVELGADMQLGLAASTMLDSRLGERQAAVDFLLRAYATADDEATRAEIAAKLAMYGASARRDWEEEVVETVRARRRSEYPFLKPDLYLLVGPVPNTDRCAGPASALDKECARDWAPVLPKGPPR
jgi:hypothetical protein